MNMGDAWTAFVAGLLIKTPDILMEILQSAIIFIMAAIIINFGKALIIKFFHKQKEFKYNINDKRADTLSTLMVSILKYTVYIITFLTIINSIFKINITTLLTAAGIGGIAIGFGAQSLVKDVISGFFILLENQFVVGDNVTIEDMTGTVEEIEMRITKIRHFNGDLFIIPNGEIKKVTNHTRGSKTAIVDVRVAYQENLDKVMGVLKKTIGNLDQEFDAIIEQPQILGVTELSTTDVVIRIIAKTIPEDSAQIERELRKKIKEAFDKEGIIIPYTKKILITGDHKTDKEILE